MTDLEELIEIIEKESHTDYTGDNDWREKERLYNKIGSSLESIKTIREYLDIMKDEPEGYIKMSEVYHALRRIIGDE